MRKTPAKSTSAKKAPAKKAPAKKASKAGALETLRDRARATKARSDVVKRRRLDALLAELKRRKQHVAEDLWDMGRALADIQREKLFVLEDAESADELAERHGILGREQARKLRRIVEGQVGREELVFAGLEKAFALVRYADATPAPDTAGSLLAEDAKIGGVPVSKASAKEIAAEATKVALAAGRKLRGVRESSVDLRAVRSALVALGVRAKSVTERDADVVIVLSRAAARRLTERD